jgi:hypothetical protein
MDKEVQLQRASLSIALIRSGADAPEVRREDAALFLKTLLRTINVCTHHDMKVRKAILACGCVAYARQMYVQLTGRASGLQRLHY